MADMFRAPDREPAIVRSWLLAQLATPAESFGEAIRKSIDEVLDGPRTGRWDYAQLEKTEKTYVGTKLEIVIRTELGLERSGRLDLEIEGIPVDIKWSGTSVWQIPREAVGQLCLCVGGLERVTRFQVGLVRCSPDRLNGGKNQDRKRTLSKAGREAMTRLVPPTPIPPNFVANMDPSLRADVMAEPTVQRRITRLFESLPGVPVPRKAVYTVARVGEGDPMRRLRTDKHAGDPLRGYKVLSAKYGNKIVRELGYPLLGKDEFMSVPVTDLDRPSQA